MSMALRSLQLLSWRDVTLAACHSGGMWPCVAAKLQLGQGLHNFILEFLQTLGWVPSTPGNLFVSKFVN